MQMGAGPGPNATEAEKEEYRQMTKSTSANMIGLMWQITKVDIMNTLVGVCNKILHDHSVGAEVLTKRREALYVLGEAYLAKCGDVNAGLEELTSKVGMQTGMFGGHGDGPDGPDASADAKDGSGGGAGAGAAGGRENMYGDVDGDAGDFTGQVRCE